MTAAFISRKACQWESCFFKSSNLSSGTKSHGGISG